jgi:pimeloyl-ACP methyl ester carboxylesterase
MLVSMDTSPRRTGIKGAAESWDFGHGAGFYIDATQQPWATHFRMESYVVQELRDIVLSNFAARADRIGVFGHSMGGHGALTLALKYPDIYKSVSAVPARHPDRPGPGRRIPRYPVAAASVRSGMLGGRPAADAAPPRRLRSQLLLHLDFHAGPHSVACGDFEYLSDRQYDCGRDSRLFIGIVLPDAFLDSRLRGNDGA